MNKRSTRFIVILSLSVVLPLIAYLIFQLTSIRKSEKIISGVYEEQLKSVLFSVNQYANDYMSRFMDKIESSSDSTFKELNENSLKFESIGYQYVSIYRIQAFDFERQNVPIFSFSGRQQDFPHEEIHDFHSSQAEVISQLISYTNKGYRKIEPAGTVELAGQSYQSILTVLSINNDQYLFTGLINPLKFVEEVLSPKMQQIANQQLILFLQEESNPDILFATDEVSNTLSVTSSVWIFPSYLLGVSPMTVTVKELIDEQRTTSLILVALLFVTMGIGIFMILRNIQREAQLNQAKTDFVSNVSHELRTPLALIRMFSETMLLGRAKNEEKKKEYLEIIFKETNRLTNIVNRILNFSRIEANRKVYHKEPIDASALLKEIMRDYSYHLEQNGFEWNIEIGDSSQMINVDREAIYEAVIILIDNAMKYSESSKHITLSLTTDPQKTHIAVADRGIGIAPEKLEQVFDKFFRVSDNDRYVAQGAGLGLSILKHIANAHEGQIHVDSELGKGSKFTLTFNNYG